MKFTCKSKMSCKMKALSQVIPVLVKNLLLFSCGMCIGYVGILIPTFTDINTSESIRMDEGQTSWLSAIISIPSLIGCALSGYLTKPFGRKRPMIMSTILYTIGWISLYFSAEMWHVFLSLSLLGLVAGLSEAPVMAYVAEITEPHLRGILSTLSPLAVVSGVFAQFVIGGFLHWRIVALISCAVPIFNFFCLLAMPETPYWLLFHNKLEEARKSLAWVRGWTTVEDVEQELREMEQFVKEKLCRVDHQTKDGGKRLCEKYFRKNFLWPFSLITVLFFILCFSGVLMLQIYGVVIFATLKVPMDKYYAEMLMGLSQLLGSMASVFAVRICGKRVMAFVTIGGLFVLNFCFATYAYVANIERLDFAGVDTSSSSSSSEYMAWIPLVLVILISFVGHCGPRVLPWIMMGEIFSNYMRAEGCAFTGCMYYILFAAASMGYLNMISTLTFSGVYWTYAGVCFFGIVFVYYALPETEGKTLVDISHHFSGQEKLSNKVNRKSISAPSPSSALGPV